jgi:hypothetical protein
MSDTNQKQDDTYSEAETAARAEATLKRMLATPPKPHKPLGTSARHDAPLSPGVYLLPPGELSADIDLRLYKVEGAAITMND